MIHEEHNVSLEQRRENFHGLVEDFEQGNQGRFEALARRIRSGARRSQRR